MPRIHLRTRINDYYISTNFIPDFIGQNGTYETMIFDQQDEDRAWEGMACERSLNLKAATEKHLEAIKTVLGWLGGDDS